MNPPVELRRLGTVEYADGLELQRQFQNARKANLTADTLLLLQHPAVLTLGRAAHLTNIIAPRDHLKKLGVDTFETDRGGDVTYHGPGQIVGYPLLFLQPGRQDVRKYVRAIEELMIRTVGDYGITATRIEKWPGVFVESSRRGGPRKIAALGVHLSRWHTKHGFALNVHPDLSHFELIVPCGIKEAGVTSIFDELQRDIPIAEVEERIAHHFQDVFDCEVTVPPEPTQTVSVVVRRSDDRILLLQRTEERGGFWQPVTGKVERDELPANAAQRELSEETAVTVPVTSLDYVHAFAFGEPQTPHIFRESAFVARVGVDAQIKTDPTEHQAMDWFSVEDALSKVPFAGLARAIQLSA